MKRSLLLYALIIALIMNLFTYMYYSKQATFEKEQSVKINKKFKDSLTSLSAKLADADYFTLQNNENAQNYFDDGTNKTIDIYKRIIPFVTEKLMDFNTNPKGNPYTGQEQLGANKFIINKIRVLNHRWIIADYSDGQYWGEVLLKYFINEDNTVSFEVNQSFLYQK